MADTPYLTAEGAERLRIELAELTGPRRRDIAERLRNAIQMGDLSENADYHKAKEDQAFLEGRIQELEYILRNAVVVEKPASTSVVAVGCRVTVQEGSEPAEVFHLVGAREADPRSGRISNESPIGQALLGKKVGDTAETQTPGGRIRFKILKIE